jgi:uncharacterized protein YjeT (DUF2065 family)
MVELIAKWIVILGGAAVAGLGATLWLRPAQGRRFLAAFASSASLHLIELANRCVLGVAILIHGPKSAFPQAMAGFGWILILTSLILLVLPWRWHRHFAERAVPLATACPRLLGTGAVVLGSAIVAMGL